MLGHKICHRSIGRPYTNFYRLCVVSLALDCCILEISLVSYRKCYFCTYAPPLSPKIWEFDRWAQQWSEPGPWANYTHAHTTVLWPFYQDQPGEPVPEENFWTLWCKGRLTEADTLTIWLGATPSGLTSVYLHHPPLFITGRMPFLPPNQKRQSTQGTGLISHDVIFRNINLLNQGSLM